LQFFEHLKLFVLLSHRESHKVIVAQQTPDWLSLRSCIHPTKVTETPWVSDEFCNSSRLANGVAHNDSLPAGAADLP
jgi:hypothetical protein